MFIFIVTYCKILLQGGTAYLSNAPDFNKIFKEYRLIHRMTQVEFAEELGVERVHISNIERGKKGMSLSLALAFCKRFNINFAVLTQISEAEDSKQKEQWIEEILKTLEELDSYKVGLIKTMICSLNIKEN